MSTLFGDLRYSLRMLLKAPGFTALAVLTLALGIGMTTAIFSAVYGVLLSPLPYEQSGRLVTLREINALGHQTSFGNPNFVDIRSQSRSFQGLAAYADVVQAVSGGSQPTRTDVAAVSPDFFTVLGVDPVLGRSFEPEEQRRGGTPVALVGYRYWLEFLGGTTDLSSQKLTVANRVASVVGVLPPGFSFPSGAEIWLPRQIFGPYAGRTAHNWRAIGRLRDGVDLRQARTELQTIASRLERQYGQDTTMTSVAIVSLRDAMTGSVRQTLWILLGAVGFLLLIACANVANLLLVQSASRRYELGVRVALGCSRWRLIRQSVTEALMLSLGGGALGALGASWGLKTLLALSPEVLPRTGEISLNTPVLVFSAGLCVLVAVVLGVFNALRSSAGLQHALASAGRSQTAVAVSERATRVLAAGQLAITLALLTGAALLGRSLLHVLSVDPGFTTEHVVTMNLALAPLPPGNADAALRRAQFLGEVMTRIRALPGVEDAGAANSLPFAEPPADGTYLVMSAGEAPPRDMQQLGTLFHDQARTGDADYASVSSGYFRVLGIPLLRGRLFDARDSAIAPHVAVVSESLARKRWPHQDPLGHRIEFGNMDGDLRPLTVVGVVGDVHRDNLEKGAFPTIYVNFAQRPPPAFSFNTVIRTSLDPAAVIAAARRLVHDLDPSLPPRFDTLFGIVSGSLHTRRFSLVLLGVFAGTALLLAVAGLYGVMAYSVARRTNEIGIRMALGASDETILSAVLRQSLTTAAIGVAVGVVASFALAHSIRSLLFGLSPTDPASFATVALLLLLVALAAGYVPARKATQVDPIRALRDE
jgi:putative ABC transport system permease protein